MSWLCRNVFGWVRSLLAYVQSGQEEAPRYRIRGDLAYWPLRLEENLTRFADGDD